MPRGSATDDAPVPSNTTSVVSRCHPLVPGMFESRLSWSGKRYFGPRL